MTTALPDVAARFAIIPQSVALGDAPYDLAAGWPGLPADRVLFLFPAGIRAVSFAYPREMDWREIDPYELREAAE